MLTVVASLAMSWLSVPSVPVAPIGDEKAAKELAELGRKIHEADSYTFVWSREGHAGGEGGAKEEANEPAPWKVEIKRKAPWHLMRGDLELFKSDEVLVAKNKDGKWTHYPPNANEKKSAPGVSGGTVGPKSGEEHKKAGGDKGGDKGGEKRTGSVGGGDGQKPDGQEGRGHNRGVERILMQIEMLPVPHRIFGDLAKKISSVLREEKEGKTVFVAELTPEGAKDVAGTAHLHRPEGEPAAAESDFSGRMRVVAIGDAITRVEFEVKAKGPNGERDIRGGLEISNVGKTEVAVPAEAMTVLNEKKQ